MHTGMSGPVSSEQQQCGMRDKQKAKAVFLGGQDLSVKYRGSVTVYREKEANRTQSGTPRGRRE